MDLGTALNVVTTLAVVAGLLFAGLQIRDAKRARTAEERLVLSARSSRRTSCGPLAVAGGSHRLLHRRAHR